MYGLLMEFTTTMGHYGKGTKLIGHSMVWMWRFLWPWSVTAEATARTTGYPWPEPQLWFSWISITAHATVWPWCDPQSWHTVLKGSNPFILWPWNPKPLPSHRRSLPLVSWSSPSLILARVRLDIWNLYSIFHCQPSVCSGDHPWSPSHLLSHWGRSQVPTSTPFIFKAFSGQGCHRRCLLNIAQPSLTSSSKDNRFFGDLAWIFFSKFWWSFLSSNPPAQPPIVPTLWSAQWCSAQDLQQLLQWSRTTTPVIWRNLFSNKFQPSRAFL